jgi:hypothetical protein
MDDIIKAGKAGLSVTHEFGEVRIPLISTEKKEEQLDERSALESHLRLIKARVEEAERCFAKLEKPLKEVLPALVRRYIDANKDTPNWVLHDFVKWVDEQGE